MFSHDGDKKFRWPCKKWILGQKTSFLAKKSVFLTLCPYIPLISPQTHLAQCDHNLPMSWDNSGYLRFSGRCPLGCLAGRFLELIAQNGPFWAKNALFWPRQQPRRPYWLRHMGLVLQDIYLLCHFVWLGRLKGLVSTSFCDPLYVLNQKGFRTYFPLF